MKNLVLWSVLLCVIAVLTSTVVHAEKKEKEDRFKITFSGVLAGPSKVIVSEDMEYGYRDNLDLVAHWYNFNREYMIPNNVLNDDYLWWPWGGFDRVLCCKNYTSLVHAGHDGFRGELGDEYLLWGRRTSADVKTSGVPLGASLEYRVKGSFWASFSFQMSPETSISVMDVGEFVRIMGIFEDTRWVQYGYPSSWYINMTRHRFEREQEHRNRAFTFAVLAKHDLTRGNSHWSIMPQVGLDLLLMRDVTEIRETEYEWKIFAGEHHPSGNVNTPWETGSETDKSVDWRQTMRPIMGLTIELYPGTKNGHIGIVADGRYHFIEKTGEHLYDASRLGEYWYDTRTERWTFSLGGVISF